MELSLQVVCMVAAFSFQFPTTAWGQYTNCPMLQESELGNTSAPTSSGLLAIALMISTGEQSVSIRLLEFKAVCLAQGTVNGTYRSTSVITTWEAISGIVQTTQLDLQCDMGSWTIDTVGVPVGTLMTTALRTDCILCLDVFRSAGVSSIMEHCFRKSSFNLCA